MSQRVLRVRELILRELGGMLQRDIDFGGVLVSINDLDVTPDFRHCHVYYGIIGTAKSERWVQDQLEKHRASFQSKLSKRVVLKNTPMLHFKLDHSVERGVRTLQLIDTLPPPAPEEPGETESGPR